MVEISGRGPQLGRILDTNRVPDIFLKIWKTRVSWQFFSGNFKLNLKKNQEIWNLIWNFPKKNRRFFENPKFLRFQKCWFFQIRSKKISTPKKINQHFFDPQKFKFIFFQKKIFSIESKKYFLEKLSFFLGIQLRCKMFRSFDLRGFQHALSTLKKDTAILPSDFFKKMSLRTRSAQPL